MSQIAYFHFFTFTVDEYGLLYRVFCIFFPKNTIYEIEQKVTMDWNVVNNRLNNGHCLARQCYRNENAFSFIKVVW